MMEVQVNGKKYNFPNDVITLEKRVDLMLKCFLELQKQVSEEINILKERVDKLEKLNI